MKFWSHNLASLILVILAQLQTQTSNALSIRRSPAEPPEFDGKEVEIALKHEETCTICLEKLVVTEGDDDQDSDRHDDDLVLFKCKHLYHAHCVGKWLENHDTCPTCRQPPRIHAHFDQTGLEKPRPTPDGVMTLRGRRQRRLILRSVFTDVH